MMMTLAFGKIETLSPHFFEAIERRASTSRQVNKIHELKDIFRQKFVYFIQISGDSMSKFFKTE
jgi:hypothetical protein